MEALDSAWVVVGKFGRPQGIKGFIRVNSFTEPRDNLLDYPNWFIQDGAEWKKIERVEEQATPQYIATKFKKYATREDVAVLTNMLIAIPKADLPKLEPDTFYWHELKGMRVIHESGQPMGVVDSIFATGSNDVLVVMGDKKRLIPYLLDDVIQEINIEAGEITVRWDLDF